jgi:HlyD family secretion protein
VRDSQQPGGEPDEEPRMAPDRITALARLEPEGGVINISGTPGDRLAELKVHRGARVKKGDVLAVMESRGLRQAELELSQAQLESAEKRGAAEEKYAAALRREAELAHKQAGLERLSVEAQQEKIAGLKISLQSAEDDLSRLQALRSSASSAETEIVSEQQLEHQRALTEKAKRDLASAEAELKKLQQSIELSQQQASAKVNTAEANEARIPSTLELDSLRKSVELAQRRLELTVLHAPSDGEILKVMLSEGETIAQQPILQMADTSQMVAVAEIYENDALRIKKGMRADVSCKALGEPLKGEVIYVGSMVLKNSVASLDPTASADLRVVEARILLDQDPDAQRLINLQVTVMIPAEPAQKDLSDKQARLDGRL